MASDKARYYLEQYVPELQEYAQKEIFNAEEIRTITSKRSDFEHILAARGSKSTDYARYATYEMNLSSLVKKRCKRLGVKSTAYSGQRTIFFILDRGTKKFPGDLALWMQYIDFCKREKANKKLAKVFAGVLRLRPRDWGLWVLAAKWYSETQGDMSTARSFMQRGLRFCKDERRLWAEYLRLEMVYLAKLAARRKILGLDEEAARQIEKQKADADEEMQDAQPVTAEDIDPDARKGIDEVDDAALKKLAAAPAFAGAIPIAIFESAIKPFNDDAEFAATLFDLCATFDRVPATRRILQHILEHMRSHPDTASGSVGAVICEAKMAIFGVPVQSEDFPEALGSALTVPRSVQAQLEPQQAAKLAEKMVLFILPYLATEQELDEDVEKVLELTARRYLNILSQQDQTTKRRSRIPMPDELAVRLRKEGQNQQADMLEALAAT